MKKFFLFGVLFFAGFLFFTSNTKAATCSLETKKMYKNYDSPSVYYISEDCKKRAVKNKDIFFSYEDSWNKVTVVNKNILENIPNHQLGFLPWGARRTYQVGSLIKSTNDPKVYMVIRPNIGNLGRGGLLNMGIASFESGEAFLKLGFQWNQIEDVEEDVITRAQKLSAIRTNVDSFPEGFIFKYENSSKVYILKKNTNYAPLRKLHIKSEAEFRGLEARFDRIAQLSDTVVIEDSEAAAAEDKLWYAYICSANLPESPDGIYPICFGKYVIHGSTKIEVRVGQINKDRVTLHLSKRSDGGAFVQTDEVLELGQEKKVLSVDGKKELTLKYKKFETKEFDGSMQDIAAIQMISKDVQIPAEGLTSLDAQPCNDFVLDGKGEHKVCLNNEFKYTFSNITISPKQISGNTVRLLVYDTEREFRVGDSVKVHDNPSMAPEVDIVVTVTKIASNYILFRID